MFGIKKEKYFLYKDCEELHPITFDWAKIFDVESNDKISIFENLKEVLNPSFYDKYLGSSDEGLKLNPKFKELFDAIESDDNDEIIDPQELEEAVTDITIKRLTSKYIVKHPSEWKYEKDKWGSIEEILEKEEDKKHFENENKRIKELQFFDDCKDIEDFPENDEVYHINPIGFVGEFGQSSECELTVEILKKIDKYIKESNAKKHLDGIKQACEKFDINTCLKKAHFLSQILHESAHLRTTKEYGGETANYQPYYGRGLIQLTLKNNYIKYSSYIGEDCYSTSVNLNKLLVSPHSGLSAGYYWMNNKLNNTADMNDFLYLTCQVNGGFNGYKDRYRILKNAFKEFNIDKNIDYKFKDSKIYDNWKYSLAWGLWHDKNSNKFKSTYMDDSKDKAKEGYNRFLSLIKSKNITFPQKRSNGKFRYHYGHKDPKTYVLERLKHL